jgi:hypothetical protein
MIKLARISIEMKSGDDSMGYSGAVRILSMHIISAKENAPSRVTERRIILRLK